MRGDPLSPRRAVARSDRASGGGQTTYVLDTSVLLAEPWSLTRFRQHDVVIPLVVLTELEAKRHHPELGWAARRCLRQLEELRTVHGTLLDPMTANAEGGTIRVEINHADPSGLPAGLTGDSKG